MEQAPHCIIGVGLALCRPAIQNAPSLYFEWCLSIALTRNFGTAVASDIPVIAAGRSR